MFSATWSNIFEENILIVSIKSLKGENETRLKNETGITIYHFLTLLQTWIELILPGEWIHQPGYGWRKVSRSLITFLSMVILPIEAITDIAFNISDISKLNNRWLYMCSNKETNWGEQRKKCKSKRNWKCYRKCRLIEFIMSPDTTYLYTIYENSIHTVLRLECSQLIQAKPNHQW